MKKCKTCKISKTLAEFSKCKKAKDGFQYSCRFCQNQHHNLWRKNLSPKERLERSRRDNRVRHSEDPNWIPKLKQKLTPEQKMDRKIKANMRSRLSQAITGYNKSASAIKDLGCSIEEFKEYLSSKFQEGMTWDNYGLKGWHIDHIFPLAKVNLSDQEQIKKAVHYTNLQPLWAEDNIKKKDKI